MFYAFASLLLLIAAAGPSSSDGNFECRTVSAEQLNQMFDRARAQPGAVLMHEPGVERVEVASDYRIDFFTEAGHFAHPSLVRRTVVQSGESVSIRTEGYTAGEGKSCADWVAEFLAQDAGARKRLADPTQQ
jgi:hypothetical protein